MTKILETRGKELLSELRRVNKNLEKIIKILESKQKDKQKDLK